MHLSRSINRRFPAARVALAAPAVLLAACQIVPQPTAPPAYLLPDTANGSISVAGVTAAPTPSPLGTTYTVKRDTLRQSVTLAGKVTPARSTQLVFHGSGTVSAVNVRVGQAVKTGDDLAEFALDDSSLQNLQAQATLSELAYESEQAKLDAMQGGANRDAIQQLQVTIEHDQAEIEKLQNDRTALDANNTKADQTLATAKDDADHKVGLAQEAVTSANDALAAAQANVQQAQDGARAASDQTKADAQNGVATASGAVKLAQREVDRATRALAVAKQNPNTTSVNAKLETQQLRVDQDREILNDAQATAASIAGQSPTTDHTARQIAAEAASAQGAAKAAERTFAADTLELKHMQADQAGAKSSDADAVNLAAQALDDAKAQLTSAQAAEDAAKQKAEALSKQTSVPARASQQSISSAQAAVKVAESGVRTAQLNLEAAQTAQSAAATATTAPTQFVEHSLKAAQLQLSSDQAKLATLQAGAPADELKREKTRVSILRDQANSASLAAQPTVTLTAPFDGTIGAVGLTAGQALAGTPQPAEGGQLAAIQLIAEGADSIVANATEADVAQLSKGATVSVSFPGLPGQTADGTIADIGATATAANNQVSYPVHIDLSSTPQGVRLGMTAQASVTTAEASDVLVAPARAVRTVSGQTLVSKVGSDGQVTSTPVQLGRTVGSNVEVVSGVAEGDVVAIFEGSSSSAAAPPGTRDTTTAAPATP